jgi:hypothetical protein
VWNHSLFLFSETRPAVRVDLRSEVAHLPEGKRTFVTAFPPLNKISISAGPARCTAVAVLPGSENPTTDKLERRPSMIYGQFAAVSVHGNGVTDKPGLILAHRTCMGPLLPVGHGIGRYLSPDVERALTSQHIFSDSGILYHVDLTVRQTVIITGEMVTVGDALSMWQTMDPHGSPQRVTLGESMSFVCDPQVVGCAADGDRAFVCVSGFLHRTKRRSRKRTLWMMECSISDRESKWSVSTPYLVDRASHPTFSVLPPSVTGTSRSLPVVTGVSHSPIQLTCNCMKRPFCLQHKWQATFYNSEHGRWDRLSESRFALPESMHGHTVTTIDGTLYVAGGTVCTTPKKKAKQDKIWRFNPAAAERREAGFVGDLAMRMAKDVRLSCGTWTVIASLDYDHVHHLK